MAGSLKFDTWLNDDDTENFKCRAFVNFNGTGTVAIRASGNVSSITDNGTGDYTVNFTNAMLDTNYNFTHAIGNSISATSFVFTFNQASQTITTSSFRFVTGSSRNDQQFTKADMNTVCVSFFR